MEADTLIPEDEENVLPPVDIPQEEAPLPPAEIVPPVEPDTEEVSVAPPPSQDVFSSDPVDAAPEAPVAAEAITATEPVDEPPMFQANKGFVVSRPRTFEEAKANRQRMFPEEAGDVSWGDVAAAVGDTNWTINNFEDLYNDFVAPERQFSDPNFKFEPKDFEGYEDYEIDYLGEAGNAEDLAKRKVEVDSRKAGMEEWSKSSWGQWAVLGAGDMAINLVTAIPIAMAAAPVAGSAGASLGLQYGTRSYGLVTGMIEGLVGGAGEAGLAYGSGQIDKSEIVYVAALGVVAGGVLSTAFPSIAPPQPGSFRWPKDYKAARLEAAEDLIDQEAAKAGTPVTPRKVDQEAALAENGTPARIKIDDTESPLVYRDGDAASDKVAIEAFDTDLPAITQGFTVGKLGAKGAASTDKAMASAFERQGYKLQADVEAYISIPASVTDLATVFKRGLLIAEKNLDALAAKSKAAAKASRKGAESFKIVKIKIPAGSKVIEGGKFKDAGTVDQIAFGNGKLDSEALPSPFDKKYDFPFQAATFTPENASKGTARFATAKAKTGDKLSADDLIKLNDDLITNGDNAAALQRGASVGAHRVDPDVYRMQNTPKDTREILNNLNKDKAAAEVGLQNSKWAFSRGAMMARSKNKAVRASVGRLMGGMLDLTRKQLDAGGIRHLAADEVKSIITRTFETRLMKSHAKNFKAFKKEFAAAYPNARMPNGKPYKGMHLEELFEQNVTAARRGMYDKGVYDANLLPSERAHADMLDGFYADWLDLMKDPGKAIGRSGEFPAIAEADRIEFKKGYTPRSFSDQAIHAAEQRFGADVLYRFLEKKLSQALAPKVNPALQAKAKAEFEAAYPDDMLNALGQFNPKKNPNVIDDLETELTYERQNLDKLIAKKQGLGRKKANVDAVEALKTEIADTRAKIKGYVETEGIVKKYLDAQAEAVKAGMNNKISDALIRKMARGMSDTIHKAKGDWRSWSDAAFGKADAQLLIKMLKANATDISDEEMALLKTFLYNKTTLQNGERAGSATYTRVFINESEDIYLPNLNGEMEALNLDQLTNTSATTLARNYTHKMSGWVGLGTVEIPELGIKGLGSTEKWDDFMNLVGEAGVDRDAANGPMRRSGFMSDESILENYMQHMTHSYPKKTWQWFQTLKMLNNIRYLGKAGFAQIGESISGLSYTGATGLMRMASFRSLTQGMFKAMRDGSFDNAWGPMSRMMDDDFLGDDMARMMNSAAYDDLSTTTGYDKVNKALQYKLEKGQNFVLQSSGLTPATQWSTKWVMLSMHDQMLKWSGKYGAGKAPIPRRFKDILKNGGLDDADIEAALLMYRDPDVVVPRGGTWTQVDNINKGSKNFDPELYFKINNAFMRMSTKAIQENKWGMMPPGFDHPLVKAVTQIRSFMIGSVTAQLINNSRKMGSIIAQGKRDLQAGNFSGTDGLGDSAMALTRVGASTVGQMASGVVAYLGLQWTIMQAMNEEDAKKHWEKVTDLSHLSMAAVSRAGWLGSVPSAYDSTIGELTGYKFDGYRSTDQVSSIAGNPSASLVKDVGRAAGGVIDLATGEGDSGDVQAIQRMFTNLIYVDLAVKYVSENVFGMDSPGIKKSPENTFGKAYDWLAGTEEKKK